MLRCCVRAGWLLQLFQFGSKIASKEGAQKRTAWARALSCRLADSLLGAVTLFYVAVLQRRAFFMQFGDGGRYEWAFSSPNVNWTWWVLHCEWQVAGCHLKKPWRQVPAASVCAACRRSSLTCCC